MAVLGSASEKLNVYYRANNALTNLTLLTSAVGPGWPSSWTTELDWSNSLRKYYFANIGDTKFTLVFIYTVGANVSANNPGYNYGAIDYFCWEPNPTASSTLRIEKLPPTQQVYDRGTYNEYPNAYRLSYPKVASTDYAVPNTLKPVFTTGLATMNNWIRFTDPPRYTRPITTDPTGTRLIFYSTSTFPTNNPNGTFFFKLLKY